MKTKFIRCYADIAKTIANLSYARRLKVGAVAVKDNKIISYGYNGTYPGDDNNCEYELPDGSLKTKPEVIHAEKNLIGKLAQSSESSKDCSIFLTHSPCIDCATLMMVAGVSEVYYLEEYRSLDGVKELEKHNIKVYKVEL